LLIAANPKARSDVPPMQKGVSALVGPVFRAVLTRLPS
jgi:hypothetical protein